MTRAARFTFGLALVLSLAAGAPGPAASRRLRWHDVRKPSAGPAESIGGYSAGCVRGAANLPRRGPGYRVWRPARRRTFGHPELVDYVRGLGRKLQAAGLGVLLVGDLGQARGGPAPNGHASHQSGLDVDLVYAAPDDTGALPAAVLAALEPPTLVDAAREVTTEAYTPRIARLLTLAADDTRVARIFVNPVIKQALCRDGAPPAALEKLRPWFGHDEHFHVRLACPAGSAGCEDQAKVPSGDGCAELTDWIGPAAREARKADQARYRSKVGAVPALPAACDALLVND